MRNIDMPRLLRLYDHERSDHIFAGEAQYENVTGPGGSGGEHVSKYVYRVGRECVH